MEARNLCDKVVEEDDKCIKGYFRRGEALVALNEHALAMTDFEKVLELDADNKAAKNKVAMCVRQIKANKQKEKKTFANMFDKVSVHTAHLYILYNLTFQFLPIDTSNSRNWHRFLSKY